MSEKNLARIGCDAYHDDPECPYFSWKALVDADDKESIESWERSASAIRNAVLEECAKIVDAFSERTPKCCPDCGVGQSAEQIAETIRSLKHGD